MTTEQQSYFVDPYAIPNPTPQIPLSGPVNVDISVYRGDSGAFRITVSPDDPEADPIDISGATWDADIRTLPDGVTVVANFDVTPVVGDISSVDVVLTSENSELLDDDHVYDIEMRIGDNVSTLMYGKILVTQDVSRTP
jgi:hypothetical protein